jgi:adenosylhomocysteine nucleosidase
MLKTRAKGRSGSSIINRSFSSDIAAWLEPKRRRRCALPAQSISKYGFAGTRKNLHAQLEMGESAATLVCFAVEDERKFFKAFAGSHPQLRTLVTGMGARNAERSFRAAIIATKPELVLSCGFAGGLHPDLRSGDVVFFADAHPVLTPALLGAGARAVQFHCAERVATTVDEKRALRESTGADAVEMESQVICRICGEENIANVVVRVILDTANEDLPLDFNRLMTADQKINYLKLSLALMSSPAKVGALLALRRQSHAAAQTLAKVLATVIAA